jgi:hypothetical protein
MVNPERTNLGIQSGFVQQHTLMRIAKVGLKCRKVLHNLKKELYKSHKPCRGYSYSIRIDLLNLNNECVNHVILNH